MSQQPLLPSDHYLMQVLAEAGVEVTEDDWRSFKAEVRRRALEGPQPAVVAGIDPATLAAIALVSQVISIGLTLIAQFFKPKPGRPAQLQARDQQGTTLNSQRRYAPRAGFDAVQDPATIGSTIPLVYALREAYGDATYGGVRVNMPLLWSQVQSFGGSQLLRAIFLLSEGRIASLDTRNFAIGNNAISSYDLMSSQANQLAGRLTVYFRPDGGRIKGTNRILGRSASLDVGNSELLGGSDVFAIQRGNGWFTDFCSSTRPSTQTTFGIYTLIGNNLGLRINPSLRPAIQPNLVPKGDEGDARVKISIDETVATQRDKYTAIFSSRSGLISGSVESVGSQIRYRLDNTSDASTIFSVALDPEIWFTSVSVLSTTGSALSTVSTTSLADLVLLGPLGVDETNEKIQLGVVFNGAAALELLKDRITTDGTYTIRYRVAFSTEPIKKDQALPPPTPGEPWYLKIARAQRAARRNEQELQGEYTVTINRFSTSTLTQEQLASYTPPQLIDNGNGSYSITTGSVSGNTYILNTQTSFSFSPLDKRFDFDYLTAKPVLEKCGDVAAAVSGRQKTWDDAIVLGDLYKVGSALAVCTQREPADELFESEADFLPFVEGGGRAVEAVFTTVRAGTTRLTDLATLRADGNAEERPERWTATNAPHVYRIALGSVSTTRPCRAVEIGIRSSMGIRIGGLCNFTDSLTCEDIDKRAGGAFEGKVVKKGQILKVQNFQSGTLTTSEERYSFFRISYREAGTDNPFTDLSPCFGIRCISQQNTYNSIRLRMGDTRQWEFRFEPLSGWEIRSGTAGGQLEIIDSRLGESRTFLQSGVRAVFKGIQVTRDKETFALNSTRRTPDSEIGIGFTDDDSYVDAWGKLAEAFVYEELQSSANSPEHEIVYLNEIVENEVAPNYDNLAIVGLNVRSSIEFQQFAQFSAYVTGGIICRRLLQGGSLGPSHLFPDVLLDLLTNPRYGRGDLIVDEMVDFDSFRESAQWCQQRGYFFDGALVGRENLRQWAADVAATHLLIFGEADGKFFLRPAFPTEAVPVRALFTAGNIREGSFRMQYLDAEERQPIQVSVRYREERAATNLSNPGLFPVEREILVREAAVPDTAPIESIDMSDYATNPQHAIDAAKFVAKFRRLSTHGIRFETTYEGVLVGLAPGDFIRVAMDTNVYDEFNNGVVTADGTLVSTQQLAAGGHNVLLWNGDSGTLPSLGTINVSADGKRATPAGVVFTVVRANRQVQTYQVESIEPSEEGYLAIEAVHTPTNDNGVLRLADGLFSNAGWVIQR